jgi:hypothetical protein
MRITNRGENLFLCFGVGCCCCTFQSRTGSTRFFCRTHLSHSLACRRRFRINCGRGTSRGLCGPFGPWFQLFLRISASASKFTLCEYNLTCMLMVSMRLPVSLTTTAFGGLSNARRSTTRIFPFSVPKYIAAPSGENAMVVRGTLTLRDRKSLEITSK